jgi:hypothetical protein
MGAQFSLVGTVEKFNDDVKHPEDITRREKGSHREESCGNQVETHKIKNALGLPATIWASLPALTPVCSILFAFRQQWKAHREYLQSHSLMEKDREFNAWKQQKRREMIQAQKEWEAEKSVAEAKREQEKKTKSIKKRRIDGNAGGSKPGVESSKDDKSPKEKWGEPFPN